MPLYIIGSGFAKKERTTDSVRESSQHHMETEKNITTKTVHIRDGGYMRIPNVIIVYNTCYYAGPADSKTNVILKGLI